MPLWLALLQGIVLPIIVYNASAAMHSQPICWALPQRGIFPTPCALLATVLGYAVRYWPFMAPISWGSLNFWLLI